MSVLTKRFPADLLTCLFLTGLCSGALILTGCASQEPAEVVYGQNSYSKPTVKKAKTTPSSSSRRSSVHAANIAADANESTHIVQAGETLASIARNYNVNWHELAKFNHMTEPYTVFAGQKIALTPSSLQANTEPTSFTIPSEQKTEKVDVSAPFSPTEDEPLLPSSDRFTDNDKVTTLPIPPVTIPSTAQHPSQPATPSVDNLPADLPAKATPNLPLNNVESEPTTLPNSPSSKPTPIPALKPQAKITKPESKQDAKVELASSSVSPDDVEKSSEKRNAHSGWFGAGTPSFSWPLKGKVLSHFGVKESGEKMDGITISAKEGTDILASAPGKVIYVGNGIKGYGNLLMIKHKSDYITTYAHADQIFVSEGEKVSEGQAVANVGTTGNISKPQLYFAIRKETKAVDPEALLP
ncbi:MAG: M23 family metallopeptidase [Alphaproteobacteria bacterium]|nr:M23 family metallopeptidase [Alphaproteobacteria bacterium]